MHIKIFEKKGKVVYLRIARSIMKVINDKGFFRKGRYRKDRKN